MGIVFINYRREHTAGEARALYKDLTGLLGPGRVFMDVDDIGLGQDFREVLRQRLSDCELMLALIGRQWLEARDAEGRRRLDQPEDFVRLEIATALQRGVAVTPVLLQDARMPGAEALPDDLKPLAFRNGFELSHQTWDSNVRELVSRLRLLPAAPTAAAAPPAPGRGMRAAGLAAAAAAVVAGGLWMTTRPDAPREPVVGLTPKPAADPAMAAASPPASAASPVTVAAAATDTDRSVLPSAASATGSPPARPPTTLAAAATPTPSTAPAPELAPAPAPAPAPATLRKAAAASAAPAPPLLVPPAPAPTPMPAASPAPSAPPIAPPSAPPVVQPQAAVPSGEAVRLVGDLTGADQTARVAAASRLGTDFKGSREAVQAAVGHLPWERFRTLAGAAPRARLLEFLLASEDTAWTPQVRRDAVLALQGLRRQIDSGETSFRPEMVERIQKLSARLGA